MKTRILFVEDEPNLGYLIKENLEEQRFDVTHCSDGAQGRQLFFASSFDLCLFDVMLPEKDGFSLAREIRVVDKNIPIIFLTAKSLREDRIAGLKIGADDYITKPFSMEELVLRIQAILKRSGAVDAPIEVATHAIGSYQFKMAEQTLIYEREQRKLTYKEAELLRLLCVHKNALLQRDLALSVIWGESNFFNARSMDVFISRLRKYLAKDKRIEIVNVHGQGFRLIAP